MSFLFFFKQKTAYDLRISDWSSDVCSSGLRDSRDISSNRPPMPTLGARSANKSNDEPTTTANNIKMNTPRRGSVAKVCTDVKDRKSVVKGKRVSVRGDLGGRRIIKKSKTTVSKKKNE